MYNYKAKVINVVDGDTLDLDIDLGFRLWLKEVRVRLAGINTPESRGRDKCELGLIAKDTVTSELLGKEVEIRSYKDITQVDSDSFGRWIVRIYLNNEDYNESLINRGLAESYMIDQDNTKNYE